MKVIVLSGNRCAGKDTFYSILSSINNSCVRFAFADALKHDLYPLISSQFNIDVFNPTSSQKELIRPIFISYGCAWRDVDINHWVKIIINHINVSHITDPSIIPVIVDLRFENELDILKSTFGDDLIHINIVRTDGPPPTYEEEKHYKGVSLEAQYHLMWGNNTEEQRYDMVNGMYQNISTIL